MGKKSRRHRHREEQEADLHEREQDLRDGMIEFSSADLTSRLGMEPLPSLGLFLHPQALRKLLDWNKTVQTAKDAGHPDPTRCGVISLKSNGHRLRLVFSDCEPGHPAALLSPLEAATLRNHQLTQEEKAKGLIG